MINRLSLNSKPCETHHLPRAFICLDLKCASTSLLCSLCVKVQHNHYSSILSFDDFRAHVENLVDKAKLKHQLDTEPVKLLTLINDKKQEIERMQLELMQLVMRRCSEEKRRMFEALEIIQRNYAERQLYFSKHQKMQSQLIGYLGPLVKNKDIFELKVTTSSHLGIERLKESLLELEKVSSAFGKKERANFVNAVVNEINMSVDLSFFKNIRQSLKETVKSQPLLFVPLPPTKKYSFKSRNSPETPQTRPQSSELSSCKAKSLASLRPVQARSQIMI